MEKIQSTRANVLTSLGNMLKRVNGTWYYKWIMSLDTTVFAGSEAHMPEEIINVVVKNEEWFAEALSLYTDYIQLAVGFDKEEVA